MFKGDDDKWLLLLSVFADQHSKAKQVIQITTTSGDNKGIANQAGKSHKLKPDYGWQIALKTSQCVHCGKMSSPYHLEYCNIIHPLLMQGGFLSYLI